jgi:hypothetical protein
MIYRNTTVIARSASDEAIQSSPVALDCFVEPVIGRRLAPTRWLAMTKKYLPSLDSGSVRTADRPE